MTSHGKNDTTEIIVVERCSVLIIGQRRSDWFLMRQFRFMGTSAGKIIIGDESVRVLLFLQPGPYASVYVTFFGESSIICSDLFLLFEVHGANDTRHNRRKRFVCCSSRMPVLNASYECGMLPMVDADWISFSTDGAALIYPTQLGLFDYDAPTLERVEIKTSFVQPSLDRALKTASVNVRTCIVRDKVYRNCVPSEHIGHFMPQMVIISVNFVVYVSTTEGGIIYYLVPKLPYSVLQECKDSQIRGAESVISWSH